MKKLICRAIVVFILAAFTACGGPDAPPEESPAPAPSAEVDVEAGKDVETGKEPETETEPEAQTEVTPFALSAEENALFEAYVKDKDVSLFKDAAPITIAKVFIQCGVTDNISAEYAMYAPDSTEDTEEEYIRKSTVDATPLPVEERQRFADLLFGLLDQGAFMEVSPTEGYIEFGTADGQNGRFHLMKDENGIWQVNYNVLH